MTVLASRRALLAAAAWSVPSTFIATAAPVYAASLLRSTLVFTNLTATEGADPCTVYTNVKVQTTDGEPVPGLVVTVAIGSDVRGTEHHLAPWGATDLITYAFTGQPRDVPILVTFRAEADGVEPISGEVTVYPPTWWRADPSTGREDHRND